MSELPTMPPLSYRSDGGGRTPRPPLDATARLLLDALPIQALVAEDIPARRDIRPTDAESVKADFGVGIREARITLPDGAEIPVGVFTHPDRPDTGPCFVFLHGGGMVMGSHIDVGRAVEKVIDHGGALFSIGYRLAPEHAAPIPLLDCYAGLRWAVDNASRFDADPERVILVGESAGGGLAAGVALLARDTDGPTLRGLQLDSPMLDDRSASISQEQFDAAGSWSRRSNVTAWRALLGDAFGTEDVSPYIAPARAGNLAGLPPTLISVGSADAFRDEDVAFASALWRDGGDCELHVLPGGVHGHETYAPQTAIARSWTETTNRWTARVLDPKRAEPDGDLVARLRSRLSRRAD